MIIKLVNMHGLKSAAEYDNSHNIAETTHESFRFAEYKIVNGQLTFTGHWKGIFTTEDLFYLLSPELEEMP